jgi:hypothetical protein
MLVELVPTRIRPTAMSLPYHGGHGWFGGFLPTVACAVVAAMVHIYHGLWYLVIIAAFTVVVGMPFLPETNKRKIEDGSSRAALFLFHGLLSRSGNAPFPARRPS